MVNTGTGLPAVEPRALYCLACDFSQKTCVRFSRLSEKTLLRLHDADDNRISQQIDFAASVRGQSFRHRELYFGKRLERGDSESVRRPMAVGRYANAGTRHPAADCGAAACDSGVGWPSGELWAAAAGSSSTAKPLSRRCAANSTLSGWKCRQARHSSGRKCLCWSRRPARYATRALHASAGEKLV